MSWNSIATADVLSEFTNAEQQALDAIQGASSNLPAILARTIAMARGQIVAGGYPLGTAGTIPDALIPDVIAIARWRWLNAMPDMPDLQTKSRKEACDDAIKRLNLVANQELAVEDPAGNATASSGWNSENKLLPRAHPIPRPGAQQTPTPNNYANPSAPADGTAA